MVVSTLIAAGLAGAVVLNTQHDKTWMTNGKVAALAQVGNRIYLGGTFTEVRATASSVGVAQPYLAAFDATTGAFISSFRPRLNGQVAALEAGPDGTLYIGGGFTTVNGVVRNRLAALDTSDGLTAFNPSANALVRTVALDSAGRLYAGGGFTKVGGVTRNRLARMDALTGALDLSWSPTADAAVKVIEPSTVRDVVYVGGDFLALNGVSGRSYLGAIKDDGTLDPWAPRPFAGIFDIATGWNTDPEINMEVVYTARGGGGGRVTAWKVNELNSKIWEKPANGDVQAVALAGDTVYAGGHFALEGTCTLCNGPSFNGTDIHSQIAAVRTDVAGTVDYDFTPQVTGFPGVWAIHVSEDNRLHLGGIFGRVNLKTQKGYVRFSEPDTTPPSVPANLRTTSIQPYQVSLAWDAASDNAGGSGLAKYRLYRDGTAIVTTTSLSYINKLLTSLTNYTYTISALDVAGNESAQSEPLAVQTADARPSRPTGLHATGVTRTTIALAWNASSDDVGVVAYRVFRNGAKVAETPNLEWTDINRKPATLYKYRVSAVDTTGKESPRSAEISVTTPS